MRSFNLKISPNTIGIDMGQSLTKIAYVEEDELCLTLIPTQAKFNEINEFLDSKNEIYTKFNFTGGKAYKLYEKFSKELSANLIDEFQSIVKGTEYVFSLENNKDLPASLIITIGTGTSVVLKSEGFFKHLGGSALGGGFFMGIFKILCDSTDFQKALNLVKRGNRYNIDLKVSDIYDPEDKRVDLLFREFTAASFGKIDKNFNLQSMKKEDLLNSVLCLIGENIGTIACLMAENNKVENIVFSGGFMINNRILKQILSLICKVNKKKAVFLKNSEYCGAIGALLSE